MSADDTSFFFLSNDLTTLFDTVYIELKEISLWFISNRLSLNVKKLSTLYSIKKSVKGSIPLKLLDLNIVNNSIKRISSINISGEMIAENVI